MPFRLAFAYKGRTDIIVDQLFRTNVNKWCIWTVVLRENFVL